MLAPTEIMGIMRKRGQAQDSFGGMWRPPNLVTLGDVYAAITADRGLTPIERDRVLAQVRQLSQGRSESTQVSQLMSGLLGGILGPLISKYFGMGVLGQATSAAAGFGLGRTIHDKLNRPPPKYKGFSFI